MIKTDNSHLKEKKHLREEVISKTESPNVLDCFAGTSEIYKGIKCKKTSIEKEPNKYPKAHLLGDSLRFLKSININQYNIIDLDAYGIPAKHLEVIFDSDYKGYVIVTAIQTGMGQMPYLILESLGYTRKMIKKCPTLFSKNGLGKLEKYLYFRGVKQITGYFFNRKYYFYFKLN